MAGIWTVSAKITLSEKLGVTALYLNPVFAAPSVHKYDTEDYRRVDEQFGGDGALLRLRENTHREGMRLILDGVFNHSGDSHAWFDRHNQTMGGACHNPESAQRDWYSFNEEGYALDWLGYPSLPKLDYASDALVQEIYGGEESIVRHWLKAPWNMDGWRLDVVHMLGEAGARGIICSTSPVSPVRRKPPGQMPLSLASISVMPVSGCRPMRKIRR